jgi:hypothetical protein
MLTTRERALAILDRYAEKDIHPRTTDAQWDAATHYLTHLDEAAPSAVQLIEGFIPHPIEVVRAREILRIDALG